MKNNKNTSTLSEKLREGRGGKCLEVIIGDRDIVEVKGGK